MAREPATAGKDIDDMLLTKSRKAEEPAQVVEAMRPAYREQVAMAPAVGTDRTTRGNARYHARQAAAAVPPTEPPPWTVTTPGLLKAQIAARAACRKTKIGVCYSCAKVKGPEGGLPPKSKRAEERVAFLEWARMAPPRKHAIETLNPTSEASTLRPVASASKRSVSTSRR
jgi:hypothetical protein